jgi:glycosyltransferase involved in cell wall biosynthesis
LTVKRIFILDPSLRDESSHHYYAACAYQQELSRLGTGWSIVCHQAAGQAIVELGAKPYFRVDGYLSKEDRSRHVEFELTTTCNAILHDQLVKLGQLSFGPGDFIFFPAITSNQILAVCQWIAGFDAVEAPQFGLCLMFQPDWHVSGDISEVGPTFYRQAFAFLPDEIRHRIVYTCETEGLAREYAALTGADPLVMPMPTLQHLAKPRDEADREITLSFMGYAKAEKGFHLLPEVARRIHERRPDVRFVVQLLGHDEGLLAEVRDGLAGLGDAVEFIEGPIEPSAMVEVMQRTRLMLMPYESATYRTRGSAIFTECKLLGVPMLLPGGTAIGDEGREKGIAAIFDRAEAEPVASAALGALERMDSLEAAARREAEAAAEARNGYLTPLIETVEAAAERKQRADQEAA